MKYDMKINLLNILAEKMCMARTVAITGHKNPDGDSLCSVLALAKLIQINFNKMPICIYDGNIPDMFDNIPLRERMQYYTHVSLIKPFDLVFVLDYGTKNHIGGAIPFVDKAKFVVEIDHHKNSDRIADLCLDKESSSSVGEIIFDIANKMGWQKDKDVNDLLAMSILTDTGFLKYSKNGTPFRIMAKLVESGVDINQLSNLLNNKPRKTVLTEAAVTSRAEFFYNGRLVIAVIDANDYKNLDGRGDIILSLLGQIKGVEYIALLKQQKENQIGVSLRSKTRPVNAIATLLGGGGHDCAAGAVVPDTLDNVKAKILELFRGVK